MQDFPVVHELPMGPSTLDFPTFDAQAVLDTFDSSPEVTDVTPEETPSAPVMAIKRTFQPSTIVRWAFALSYLLRRRLPRLYFPRRLQLLTFPSFRLLGSGKKGSMVS